MGGEVDVIIDTGTVIRPQAEAGVYDILAITSGERWPDAPDLPTVSETVAPDFDVVSWTGIGMPAGVPTEIADRIRTEVHAALAVSAVNDKIASLGAKPSPSSGEDMTDLIKGQIAVWTDVIKTAGIDKR